MRRVTSKLGFNKSLQAAVRQAMKTYDFSKVTLLLDKAESLLSDEKELDRLISLRAYLEDHKRQGRHGRKEMLRIWQGY